MAAKPAFKPQALAEIHFPGLVPPTTCIDGGSMQLSTAGSIHTTARREDSKVFIKSDGNSICHNLADFMYAAAKDSSPDNMDRFRHVNFRSTGSPFQ